MSIRNRIFNVIRMHLGSSDMAGVAGDLDELLSEHAECHNARGRWLGRRQVLSGIRRYLECDEMKQPPEECGNVSTLPLCYSCDNPAERITELEAENERLRKSLAELEESHQKVESERNARGRKIAKLKAESKYALAFPTEFAAFVAQCERRLKEE